MRVGLKQPKIIRFPPAFHIRHGYRRATFSPGEGMRLRRQQLAKSQFVHLRKGAKKPTLSGRLLQFIREAGSPA